MVGVVVREEDLAQVDEPDLGPQQLPLRPLAAVDEQTLAAAPDEQRAGRALGGRHRAGRAEEDDVEVHPASLGGPGYAEGSTRRCPGTIVVPRRPLRSRSFQIAARGSPG